MITFEDKHLIAFTDEELDNLCAICNAAWLFWEQKERDTIKRGNSNETVSTMKSIASVYWRKLYHIKVGE